MSPPERNEDVFRRYIAAVSGTDLDHDVLDETLAEDVTHHGLPDEQQSGRARMKAQQASFGSTWADRHIEIEDLVAAGDRVAARLVLTARHVGAFAGIEPTGTDVSVDLMAFARIENGRIAEWWEVADVLSLLEQLGASPLDQRAASGGSPTPTDDGGSLCATPDTHSHGFREACEVTL